MGKTADRDRYGKSVSSARIQRRQRAGIPFGIASLTCGQVLNGLPQGFALPALTCLAVQRTIKPIEGIGKHGFVLTPGRYVGAEEQEDDGEPFTEKYPRLLAELEESFGEADRLMAVVREKLGNLQNGE